MRMFEEENEDCVFMELCTKLKKSPHMVIECVPMPREIGDMAPIYFKVSVHYFKTVLLTINEKKTCCVAFSVNGHQRLNNGIYYLIKVCFIHE